MTLGARLRERLDASHMSQSELARRVSLTQGTIAALLSGRSRSSAHLHKIAKALGTSPEYLTGETDDPSSEGPEPSPLDSQARELIDHFSDMSPADRRALLQIARSMRGKPNGGGRAHTIHAPRTEYRASNEGEGDEGAEEVRRRA
ncbi:helix-turn-helix domain-containing protein [Stakelama tenebrarum]|uniref:Helix-turn-helix transcriptional regulator n=1 Tax=Stakelama tenebrarum TaxID=2711215 RepID=A0A6G6Y591_9SPHN|nr:helix-turn-helix transcriptional regulator [Sphingosinithalassobacter tenebrarum]QIG80085.1 helix-turn-helix transcriptional regulator [Sphingosinithalassobacter tenebrarum]